MHDGCLLLEEPIPITDQLIHRITQILCKGEDPVNISEGKSDDVAIVEAMKKKFKLEKNKRGYIISSIKNVAVKVAMRYWLERLCRSAARMRCQRRWLHLLRNA